MNDFKVDLTYSLDENENKLFDNFYYNRFYGLREIELVKDIELQRQGIDKILNFDNGKKLYIDEKKRRKDYGDILLEEYSDYDRKIEGWLSTAKKTDYIVYAIMPTKIVFVLPFLVLQSAYKRNYEILSQECKRHFAKNDGYITSSLGVSYSLLFSMLDREMRASL